MKSVSIGIIFAVVSVFHTVGFSRAAGADEPKRAVIVGIDIENYMPAKDNWRKEFGTMLEMKLQQADQNPLPLSSTSTPCEDAACFEKQLGLIGASTGIYVKVSRELSHPPAYIINLYIYQKNVASPFRRQTAKCISCSEYQTKERLAALFSELYYSTISPIPLISTSNDSEEGISHRKRAGWYTVGAVGSALVVAGAIGLGISAAQHGSDACASDLPTNRTCTLRHNNTTAIAISATGLGVGAILAPIGFVLASRIGNAHKISLSTNGFGFTLAGAF